jgi:hypothetical protein
MSLTSYRAAPPRAKARKGPCVDGRKEGSDLGGSGDDLLSRVLRHSTMGAEAFNGRVRDGIGFWAPRLDHRTGQDQTASTGASSRVFLTPHGRPHAPKGVLTPRTGRDHKSDQANRAISTSRLNASPRLHPWPINVVVFHGSQGSSRFKGGFPLRCLQRLSRPYIAMLHCGWRHNSSTRGTSIPVLSY